MIGDLDITIVVPGMELAPGVLQNGSLGGSETAGLQVAVALAALGHHVTVFGSTNGQQYLEGRVLFMPIEQAGQYLAMVPSDVVIVQRLPELFGQPTNSRLNILWMHDLALARSGSKFRGVLWNVDKVFVLSDFQKQQYQDVYEHEERVYYVTRNGIDLSVFPKIEEVPRNDHVLIYGARPERGLDILLRDIMPKIWAARPDVQLQLCTYKNSHPSMHAFYDYVDRLIDAARAPNPERVKWLGYLKKADLAYAYAEASLYVYPTPSKRLEHFAEISCISLMEAMAAGLPVVASNRGALPETLIKHAGVLIDGDPWTPAYQETFAQTVLQLLADPKARRAMGTVGFLNAQALGWDPIAKDWAARFAEWIAEANTRPARLVRHFLWMSDVVMARAAVARMPEGPERAELQQLIDGGQWGFVAGGSYKEQYEKPKHDLEVFDGVPHETRFQWLVAELQQRPHLKTILDVGCAHASYALQASKVLAERGSDPRHWVSTDISEHSIECARKLRAERATYKDRHTFLVGNEDLDIAAALTEPPTALPAGEQTPPLQPGMAEEFANGIAAQPPFDALVAFEVIEHVPEPWTFMQKLERWLGPDSEVLITVPSGPWEAMSFETYPHRFHIWHFDLHDLREMFGHKPEYRAAFTPWMRSPRDGAAIGWWFVRYKVGTEPVRPINIDRHLALQRPRETLSAVIMVGPGAEEQLHWCLRPIVPLADEIVVVDNGMTMEAHRILRQYPVRIIPGADPRQQGFETPRNIGLAAARMDWVLWIDTDERLLEVPNIPKYLRRNSFDGYGITQHHFACDTKFKPDLPVRIFRNNGWRTDGKTIKFWGMIHEHPEVTYNDGPGRTVILADVHIAHVGYLTEGIRRGRFQRNAPMLAADRAKYPDRFLGHHFEIRDNMLMVNFILEQTGGQPNEQVYELCRKTRDLWRQHFLGQQFYLREETLAYYSQALRILDEGFDLSWVMAASRDGAVAQGEQHTARFGSVEEAERTLAVEAKGQAQIFTSKYW